ncbi:MAG: TetR/AcrR family transcriptional regulator [Pseudomonadota bacterium]
MARPREFDETEAVRGATDIFWRQGFKATSLPELLKSMNMTRGSFYLAFGTKQNVYSMSLDDYDSRILDAVVAQMENCDADGVWDCLAGLFRESHGDRRGCFICNAMVELGPDDPEVAAKANAMAGRLRGAIEGVLTRHQQVPDAAAARDCADLILHIYFGHQAVGRAGEPKPDWEPALKMLLAKYGFA